MTGDGTIVARVATIQNSTPVAKAGVMMRDALTPGAANITVFGTPTTGVNTDWRTTDGGSTAQAARIFPTAPYWVKLSRTANVFTTYYSTDGINFAFR